MPVLNSKLKPDCAGFAADRQAMHERIVQLEQITAATARGGSDDARTRHASRGKMLPRERVAALLDRDTPFLELSALAAHDVYDEAVPSAGIITGVGTVSSCYCRRGSRRRHAHR